MGRERPATGQKRGRRVDLGIFLLSFSAAVFLALGLVLTTFGLRSLSPLVGASYSVPTSFVMFLVISPVTVDLSGLDWRAAAIFAAAGVFYPAVVSMLNFMSNRALGPNLTGGLGNLSPIFAIGLAVVLLGELPSVAQWAGIAAVCAGLVLLALDRARRIPGTQLKLLAVPLAGAFFRGAVQPVVKLGLLIWPSAFAAALLGYLMSSLVIWIMRLATGQKTPPGARAGVLWFMSIGLCNGIALVLLYLALGRGEVVQVSPVVALYPLLTIGLNRMIHGDRSMGPRGLLGSLVSVAGVIVVLLG
ncbi:DMT family transporter [Pseudooceanicola nitratireducens]|uniref:DMT family transporter n=1 Tax=Pseudooceanicola nitratireducens TaxID=517719 RepID=UPI0023F27B1C|nr:DMT family transporter [Pseudooceanicola nitratireducens]